MTGQPLLLAVDGGQTATKALVADLSGRVLGRGQGTAWDHLSNPDGREHSYRGLQEAAGAALCAACGSPVPAGLCFAAACVGATGLAGLANPGRPLVEGWLAELVAPEHTRVVGDIVTNLAGASGGRPGVVVIAGGGSAAWGTDGQGNEHMAGGWGHLLGDEGSGYDLGRQAIVAAARAADGRGPATALVALVPQHFGKEALSQVRGAVYSGELGRPQIASLAPVVTQAAVSGDKVAATLVQYAGRELALAAAVVARGLRQGDERVGVYPTGGVLAARPIHTAFRRALGRIAPFARVETPLLEPVGGALVLALQEAGVQVSAMVLDAIANSYRIT